MNENHWKLLPHGDHLTHITTLREFFMDEKFFSVTTP